LEFELPKNFSFFYLTWLSNIMNNYQLGSLNMKNNSKKNNSKKKQLTKENLAVSEFEILLPRNCLFKIDKISTIDERFFTRIGDTWEDYEKYLNTGNGLKKIKVYHLKFVERKDAPLAELNNPNISTIGIPKDNIYYIPQKMDDSW